MDRFDRTNKALMYHLIKEGKRTKTWILNTGFRMWLTPEEVEDRAVNDPNFSMEDDDKWVLADPIMAIKEADAKIESLRKKREEFSVRILEYYKNR